MLIAVLEKEEIRNRVAPITVNQYHKLYDSGLISENVELITGVIIEKMPKSPLHTSIVEFLCDFFREVLSKDYRIRQEQPLTLEDSEPEPDILIVKAQPFSFVESHPKTGLLVVEVSISSRVLDVEKKEIYANANICEYWIISPEKNQIEVFSNLKNGKYQTEKIYSIGDKITINIEKNIFLQIQDIFPEKKSFTI